MVNVRGVPKQVVPPSVNAGVTVMVATSGVVPGFCAANEGMSPVPLAAKPMAGVLLVQLNTVPAGVPVKVTAVVLLSLHSNWLAMAFTVGVGLTVMVNVMAVPTHPAKLGVTVMVPVMAAPPALVGVKVGKLPEPLAARPMAVLLFVQVNVAPVTLLPKAGGVTGLPLQYT